MTEKIDCSHEDGCPVVRKAVKEIVDQITKLKAYKVSWPALVTIFAFVVSIFGVGTYLFGADVINIVKETPQLKEKIDYAYIQTQDASDRRQRGIDHEKRITSLETKLDDKLTNIEELLKEMAGKKDKNARTQ